MKEHGVVGCESTSSLATRIARNSLWSAFAAVASPVLMFLFGGLTIRYLGLEAAGVSVVLASIFGVASRLMLLGVSESFVPRMAAAVAAADHREMRTLFGTVTLFSTAMSVVTAVIIVGCRHFVVGAGSATGWFDDIGMFVLLASITHVVTTVQQVFSSVLRAAQRFDLLTAFTLPISFVTGLCGCAILPMFPRLSAVAGVSLISSVVSLLAAAALARRTVPDISRPVVALGILVPLVRYGAWITLSNLLSVLTASIDALVLAAVCGTSAVAPYNIAKQLFITGHTMLLQQTEHIGPTLSALGHDRQLLADRISSGMLWLTVMLAAIGYSCIAWLGPSLVGVVAGGMVAEASRVAIISYAAYGLAMSLLVVPITQGIATGFPKLAFLVGLAIGPSLVVGLAVLGNVFGVPAVYAAPLIAIPGLLMLFGTTPDSICDRQTLCRRLALIAAPASLAIGFILGAALVGDVLSRPGRFVIVAAVAIGLFPAALLIERATRNNCDLHDLAIGFFVSSSKRFFNRLTS